MQTLNRLLSSRLFHHWQWVLLAIWFASVFQAQPMLAVTPTHSEGLGNEMEVGNGTVFLPIIAKPEPWKTGAPMFVARRGHTATLLLNGKVLVTGGYNAADFSLNSVEAYDPDTQTWTMLAPMNMARYNHTASLLPDGRVLVAGGTWTSSGVGSSEIYDPATDTWTSVASMNIDRSNHTATLLLNGNILVTGGNHFMDLSLNSAEIYDLSTNIWTVVASMNQARHSHTAILLPNHKVLITGGFDHDISVYDHTWSSTEVYDPDTNTWTMMAPMNVARATHTANFLPDGRIMVIGGYYQNYCLASAEVYDPEANTWTRVDWFNTAHCRHTALVRTDGKILVVGGFESAGDVKLWDSDQEVWTTRGPLQENRSEHTITQLTNGKVLVTGGCDDNYVSLKSVEEYEPAYDTWMPEATTWTVLPSMNVAHDRHTATLLSDHQVLIVGGGPDDNLGSVEIYDSNTNMWTTVASLNTPRQNHTATLLPDGKVLVVGGSNLEYIPLNSAEVYDPSTDTWTTVASMNNARYEHTMTLLPNGKILVVGGSDLLYAPLSSAEVYDPATNTWTTVASMNDARSEHTMTLLPDGSVLVTGGFGGSNFSVITVDSVEVYDPDLNTWTTVAPLHTGRVEHIAVLLNSGEVLVTGGINYGTGMELSSAEIYHPDTDTWTESGFMTTERALHAAVLLLDGRVLVTGGYRHFYIAYSSFNDVEVFDPNTGTWTSITPMIVAPIYHTVTLLPNGKVLIIGGNSPGEGNLNLALLYDPGP